MGDDPRSIVEVALSDLFIDSTLQPRVSGIDSTHAAMLAETPEAWPPLVAARRGESLVVIDGAHRYQAALQLGLETVTVEVRELTSEDDERALAFALNLRHGRPLTLADRKAEALRILQLDAARSSRSVARACGLSHVTVERLRAEAERSGQIDHSDTREGEGGYTYHVPSRRAGELAPEGIGEAIGRGVAGLVAGREARDQRRAASYLLRVADALDDQYRLPDSSPETLAAAARARLGEEAGVLADRLGPGALNLLQAARLLGYEPVTGVEE